MSVNKFNSCFYIYFAYYFHRVLKNNQFLEPCDDWKGHLVMRREMLNLQTYDLNGHSVIGGEIVNPSDLDILFSLQTPGVPTPHLFY